MPTQQSRNPELASRPSTTWKTVALSHWGLRILQLSAKAFVAGRPAITIRGTVNIRSPEAMSPGTTQSRLPTNVAAP